MIDKMGSSFRDYAPLMARLGLSIIVIVAGGYAVAGKSSGVARHLVSLAELPNTVWGLIALIAGLLVFIGFATRMAGLFLFIVLTLALVRQGSSAFANPSEHLLLACVALSLAVFCGGGGLYSIDHKLEKKKAK